MTTLLAASTHGYWNLQTLWFFLIVVLWVGYFVLEGFDFGVGTLLPFVGRDVAERGDADPDDRAGVGRERGLAARRRRRHLRRVPGLVRVALLRLLPRALPRARGTDRPRRRDRVPQQAARRALAVALGRDARRSRARCPRSSGASPWRTSSTACRSTRNGEFTGNLLDLLGPYALFGGLTSLALFTFHGAALPDAPDDRRAPRAGAARGDHARVPGGRARPRLPRLDVRERGLGAQQGSRPGRDPDRRDAAAVRRRRPRPRRQGRARVRRDRASRSR